VAFKGQYKLTGEDTVTEEQEKRQARLAARIAGENRDAADKLLGRSGELYEVEKAMRHAFDSGDFDEAVRLRQIEKKLEGE
jgi:hypothetical protein